MGLYVFKLPDVGEGTAEAEIAAWHVAVGDTVAEDQPLVDIMTEKATVEIPSPVAGKVVALHGSPGDRRQVGTALVEIEIAGDITAEPAPLPEPPEGKSQPPATAKRAAREAAPETPAPEPAAAARPLASPAVRERARELGVRLEQVPGSGPGGRIRHRDLDLYLETRRGRPVAGGGAQPDEVEEVKVIGLRRVIAERMQEAKRRIPHFSYVEEVDVTALEELRAQLNAGASDKPRLTVLPFLMRAIVRTVPEFPQVNARYDDEAGVLRRHRAVHIGIATQTPGGLMVPVVRHAAGLGLWDAAGEVARLAEAARAGKASREELSGSTITVTSLGALGGIVSTPVINYPEVAIVGVNRIAERPMICDGQVVARKMMNLSSSFDHRMVDGWDAAAFIQRLKGLLENPPMLLVS